MTAGGESDIGSVDGMMPEDVEAAYQVFISIGWSACSYWIDFIFLKI